MLKKEIRRDKVLIFIWPIIASIISFLVKANYFVSIILFFGLPSVYLSFRDKGLIKKSILFSGLFGVPFAIIINYIAILSRTWWTPTIFPFKLFGIISIDDFLWVFLYVYFIVMYYEYFLEHKFKDKLYYPYFKYLIIGILTLFLIFSIVIFINPHLLNINYYYLKMGIIAMALPIIMVLLKFPNLFTKFFKAGAYFFYLSFIYEVTALRLKLWDFPANSFIGFVNIFGVQFPFEEFFFWIMLGAIAILSYYEFFDDDKK